MAVIAVHVGRKDQGTAESGRNDLPVPELEVAAIFWLPILVKVDQTVKPSLDLYSLVDVEVCPDP